jgi:hypothetical protein
LFLKLCFCKVNNHPSEIDSLPIGLSRTRHREIGDSIWNRDAMTSSIEWKYRISSQGGLLYVRECMTGEIIARIPSGHSASDPGDTSEVLAACAPHFLRAVESFVIVEDALYVTCKIAAGQLT